MDSACSPRLRLVIEASPGLRPGDGDLPGDATGVVRQIDDEPSKHMFCYDQLHRVVALGTLADRVRVWQLDVTGYK